MCGLLDAVLTAAHCAWDFGGDHTYRLVKVLLAAHKLGADIDMIAIEEGMPPPGAHLLRAVDVYYPKVFHDMSRQDKNELGLDGADLALVELEQSVLGPYAQIGAPPLTFSL
jgi:hypothetical protein